MYMLTKHNSNINKSVSNNIVLNCIWLKIPHKKFQYFGFLNLDPVSWILLFLACSSSSSSSLLITILSLFLFNLLPTVLLNPPNISAISRSPTSFPSWSSSSDPSFSFSIFSSLSLKPPYDILPYLRSWLS